MTETSSPPVPSASAAGYDVAAIRSRYPALGDGWAYLDGAAGTQVPRSVIDAEAAAYASGIGNHGGAFAASKRSDALTTGAREAIADLVGAPSPQGVVLGPSSTALAYRMAQALGRSWSTGESSNSISAPRGGCEDPARQGGDRKPASRTPSGRRRTSG